MSIIKSRINKVDPAYKSNLKHNEELYKSIEKINILNRKKIDGGLKKHREQGKFHARERINMLTDEETPFLELSPLAANGQYDDQFPAAGIITGIGVVHGQDVMVVANDATVKGGTYIRETIKKHLRAQEIALQNNLPIIYLVDSGGIYLPEQSRVYPDYDHFGRIFYNQAKLSAEGIPQIAVVLGYCTAGGAYIPAMSDENIIVKDTGTIFLAGPSLVREATGEVVTNEELGGAWVHSSISGVADHLAQDEKEAIQKCREIIGYLNPQKKYRLNKVEIEPPLYPPGELLGLIPKDNKKHYDAREVIARIVDGSKLQEFKANYGKTIITGFARIYGFTVGVIANNGILFSESALKATHFIELCCHRKIPLVFLHDIKGFMVGKEYEHKGIAKDGAKMIHAVANANVPKFTVITGGSYGAGNYAMAGRAYNPNFLFLWPNARTAVMGSDQASGVLARLKMKAGGKSFTQQDQEKLRSEILEQFEKESSALYSTSRLWDDGIINPASTREYLGIGLSISLNKDYPVPKTGVYRM